MTRCCGPDEVELLGASSKMLQRRRTRGRLLSDVRARASSVIVQLQAIQRRTVKRDNWAKVGEVKRSVEVTLMELPGGR